MDAKKFLTKYKLWILQACLQNICYWILVIRLAWSNIQTISFQIIGTLCTRVFRTFRYSETTVEQCNMYCYCTKYANLVQKIAAVQEYTQYYIKDGVSWKGLILFYYPLHRNQPQLHSLSNLVIKQRFA